MTTSPPSRVSPSGPSTTISLPKTRAPASFAGASQNPTCPTRVAPGPPSQNTNMTSESPSARLSSIRSPTPSTFSRQSDQHTPTTAASSIHTQNLPTSSPSPQLVSPDTQNVSPNSSSGMSAHHQSHKLPSIVVEWRWELFTWALGTLAMSLILTLLCIYKDKSITSWKSTVQISAVVAIFSQLAQSALIVSVSATIGQAKWSTLQSKRRTIDVERFDEAMRGPEGSLKMLAAAISNPRSPDMKRFRTYLALVASLVTLLMLSFGTFTQQSVATYVRRVENLSTIIRASSTVNRALSYRDEDSTPSQVPLAQPEGPFATPNVELERSFLEQGNYGIDTTLSGAVLAGIATSHSLSDVAAQCATNDCRWPSYPTLAICSTVEDVSSQLILEEVFQDPDPEFVFYLEDMNMTLPIPELYNPEQGNPTFAGPTDFWMATLPAWRENHVNVRPNSIADVYITYFSACRATNNTFGKPAEDELSMARANLTNWRAFRGSFELCVHNLTTSIINGATNTSIVERVDKQPWIARGKDNVVFYAEAGNTSSSDRVPFSIDVSSLLALGDIMRLTLNGSAKMRAKSDKKWESSEQIILAQDVYSADPEICRPGPNTDINGFRNRMQNIALSLTNALRRNPAGLEHVQGSTFSDEQFIDVNLAWLAMPIALWVIVTLLLLSTMWRTMRLQLPSWKTSTLPWLECQLEDNDLSTRSDMKKSAKTSYTQLRGNNSAWYLERTT